MGDASTTLMTHDAHDPPVLALDEAANARMAEAGHYIHLALQAPPVAIGDAALQVILHERLEDIATRLEEQKPDLFAKKHFPLVLSDASASSCDMETQLRKGLIHCMVWCAKGVGWEARDETQRMPSLQSIIEIIAALPASSASPRMAVVCLQYGAHAPGSYMHRECRQSSGLAWTCSVTSARQYSAG